MSLSLDPKRPIYLQIMEEIKKRAVRGEYSSGERLPSVRDLAKETGVNPNTVARVYMELEREGFIFTRRGQGSFITEDGDLIESERIKLADSAAERFVREIEDLALTNGHRGTLIDMIRDQLGSKKLAHGSDENNN